MKIIKVAQEFKYSRVKAKDYFQLMREMERGIKNISLLDKMIYDLEPAVVQIYYNTTAMGHTSEDLTFPCPSCEDGNIRIDDMLHGEVILMNHYDDISDMEEGEMSMLNDDNIKKIESQPYGGFFICWSCMKLMTFDEVDNYIEDPTGTDHHARGSLMSDEINHVFRLLQRAKDSTSFEDKFANFEAIIEYAHKSGDISHFFIEGGTVTIDRYRDGEVV